jgi:lipoate-protein ligase A
MSEDRWLILESGACDYALNMAVDEVLMQHAPEIGKPVLRFYAWQQAAASFGYFQKAADIEAVTHLRPLVRRPTGGGLVPHDRDWTYSVAVPPNHAWYQLRASESYERMHAWIRDAFGRLSISTELAPCCRKELPGQCFAGYEQHDLLWLGRKIAGAAQRRTRAGLLIQGSIQPQPPGIDRASWERAMSAVASEQWNAVSEPWHLPGDLMKDAQALAEAKYSQESYNFKR